MPTNARSSLSPLALRELADLNFIESFREHARWCALGVVDERDDTLRVLNATRFAAGFFNGVICTGQPPADPHAWLEAQRAFYGNHQRGFSVYLRGERDAAIGEACKAGGLNLMDAPPGMVIDAPVPTMELPAGATLEHVEDPDGLREVAAVLGNAYALLGLPESVTARVLGEPERMLAPHRLWFLARSEGTPAAAAMVLLSHSIAGIYWVGARPALRGSRLGEACTRAAIDAAFACGARAVVLQASRLGEAVYQRIGFREFTRYPWYLSARS